jgi:hypothetical protein
LLGGFNGFNCRYYLSVFVFNDKFNLSFAMRFARFGVGGFKGCFDVGKTTVQLSNIDAGAGGISLTANDKHSNDKHADNNLANQSDNNPANQPSNNPTNQASNNPEGLGAVFVAFHCQIMSVLLSFSFVLESSTL